MEAKFPIDAIEASDHPLVIMEKVQGVLLAMGKKAQAKQWWKTATKAMYKSGYLGVLDKVMKFVKVQPTNGLLVIYG